MELLERFGSNRLLAGLDSSSAAEIMSIPVDPTVIVTKLAECYRDMDIQRERQATLRTQIREYSRICNWVIEANTRIFEARLSAVKGERMELVKTICEIARRKEIDENSLKLCELFLNYLSAHDLGDMAGGFLQMPSPILELEGGG